MAGLTSDRGEGEGLDWRGRSWFGMVGVIPLCKDTQQVEAVSVGSVDIIGLQSPVGVVVVPLTQSASHVLAGFVQLGVQRHKPSPTKRC